MSVTLEEQRLGETRWIVVSGPAIEAFRALGRHMEADIRAALDEWEYPARLRQHVASSPGRERLAAVLEATQESFPDVWAELAALADGAGVPLDDLALLNFHADLGPIGPTGGCSDLTWSGKETILAHNEDDSYFLLGRTVLLTLALDGQPTLTTYWKPGCISSTFTVTATGMVWSHNHLPVASPGRYPGRQFVARGLQQRADTLDQAIEYLRDHPSAGGMATNIADRSGRIVTIEAMSGQFELREVGPHCPLGWQTNHGRYVTGADAGAGAGDTSMARGEVLEALEIPAGEPDIAWFARILAGATPPYGAKIDASLGLGWGTLCTFIANLTTGEAVLLSEGSQAVSIPLADLAHGRAGNSRRCTPPSSRVLSPDPPVGCGGEG